MSGVAYVIYDLEHESSAVVSFPRGMWLAALSHNSVVEQADHTVLPESIGMRFALAWIYGTVRTLHCIGAFMSLSWLDQRLAFIELLN
jgi:hypothetical protein